MRFNLREEQLLPHLDEWLCRKFDPIALNSTVRELEAAQVDDPKPDDEPAQREIAECDAKLRQHRVALEAGADPADKAEVYGQLGLTLTCKFALNDLGDER